MRHFKSWGFAALVLGLVVLSASSARAVESHKGATLEKGINLNTASVEQLIKLPGIGRSRAIDIITRRSRKKFRHPRELMRIKGIGRRTYYKILPLVRVEDVRVEEVKGNVSDGRQEDS